MEVPPNAIVLDVGSATTKAGLSGELLPSLVFPTVVNGRAPNVNVGDETSNVDDMLRYPVEGTQCQWDDMEHIYRYPFKYFNFSPQQTPLLISAVTMSGLFRKPYREKAAQILFEQLGIPALCMVDSHRLSLYAVGKYEGLVVECGEYCSSVAPVIEIHDFYHSYRQDIVTGRELTEWTSQKLRQLGHELNEDYSQDVKEKLGSVWTEDNSNNSSKIEYQLPDGNKIFLGKERFDFLEPLFGNERGVHKAIIESVREIAVFPDNKKPDVIWNNIILSGGTTLSNGMTKRLAKELSEAGIKNFNIIDSPERLYNPWIGGSTIASLNTFSEICWTLDDYNERGPAVGTTTKRYF